MKVTIAAKKMNISQSFSDYAEKVTEATSGRAVITEIGSRFDRK